jgi:hypothetical protein
LGGSKRGNPLPRYFSTYKDFRLQRWRGVNKKLGESGGRCVWIIRTGSNNLLRSLTWMDRKIDFLIGLFLVPILVVARSKGWLCGRLPAWIVVSNSTGGMNVCLLWMLSIVR